VPRTYLDFDLLIERAGTGYRARVLDSPGGQATIEFAMPFSTLEIENFLLRITRSLGDVRQRIRGLESPERDLVRGFGSQLFGAVFSGTVQDALQTSLNEAYDKNVGLRVRLHLTDTPELADLPWEFLHNTSSHRFLSLSPDTPLVRYLDLPLPAHPLAVTPPIRVLVMISSPTDFPQLDVAAEWDRLESSLRDLIERGLVSLTRLPTATLASLQRPLRLSEYHIFHFIGHGGFDEQSQDGALALQDPQGRARLVTGQDLGVMLSDHHSLRLVILNACEGARSAASDPFAGVAQTLVQQAIPAVIAMQFEITDEAAITFAHEFYGAVADGYPVDAALAESRRAIFAQGNEVEWATPVLYMRSPNGQLFKITRSSPQVVKEVAEKEPSEQRAREEAEKEAAQREHTDRLTPDKAEKQARERSVGKSSKKRVRMTLGAAAIVAALVTAAVSLVAVLHPLSGGPSTPASASSGVSSSASASQQTTIAGAPVGVFAQGQLTMMSPDDADLDGGHVGTSVQGGDLYLYCSVGECLLNPIGSGMMTPTTGPADKSTCVAALRARQDGAIQLSQLDNKSWLCLQTSEAHLAALQILSLPGIGTAQFVFRYTVWE
jgi:hypothetical protein